MGSTWDHPELGRFKYDGMDWTPKVDVPAFKAFGLGNARRSKGTYELSFEADDEDDVPSPAAAALASKALANQAGLAAKVKAALWDDFNGRGPTSGMWWHGNLDEVAEVADLDDPPAKADDLLKLMRLSCIQVRKGVDGYNKPVVELSFDAAFEDEHGVGVLTDGETVLGTGYSADVSPFKPARRRPSGK